MTTSGLKRAVAYHYAKRDDARPVQSYIFNRTPSLSKPNRPQRHSRKANGFSVSHDLSYLFKAIEEHSISDSRLELFFITINYSPKRSAEVIAGENHSPIGYLAKQLNRRFRDVLGYKPEYVAIAEKSRDGSLHLHLFMAAAKEDISHIKQNCQAVSKGDNNSVMIKQEYWRRLDHFDQPKTTGMKRKAVPTLVDDYFMLGHEEFWNSLQGINIYPVVSKLEYDEAQNRYINGGLHVIRPLDLGLADYLSKELKSPILGGQSTKNGNIYSSLNMKRRARELITEAFDSISRFVI